MHTNNTSFYCFSVILPAAAIRDGLDVVVGTPGRILDHMVNGTLDLTQLK